MTKTEHYDEMAHELMRIREEIWALKYEHDCASPEYAAHGRSADVVSRALKRIFDADWSAKE